MQQNWLAYAVGRPWLTWSSGSIGADWLRSRSLLAEDASRRTLPVIVRGSSRLPSDRLTGVRTGRQRGH